MASIGTVENVNFSRGWGVFKNAVFLNNGRRPNRIISSSMNDRIAPGIWSPFLSTTSPSYPTCHRYLWKSYLKLKSVCSPPKKKVFLMKHTPPLKFFITSDRTYWNHILGFRVLAFLSSKRLKWKKSDEPFFRNCTHDFLIVFLWFSLRGPIRFFCCQSILVQEGPNVEF